MTVEVNVGDSDKKDVNMSGVSGWMCDSSKAKAAAFISRKLAEEHKNSKPSLAEVELKRSDK